MKSNKNKKNLFNNQNNTMNKINDLLPKGTMKSLKHISSLILGITPMLLAIIFVGPESLNLNWRLNTKLEVPYGAMWGVGISLIFLSALFSIIISYLSKEINRDIIPFTIAWSLFMFGIYIIPLTGNLLFLFIIILPILWFLGFIMGILSTAFFTMIKLNKDMQKIQKEDPKVKEEINKIINNFNNNIDKNNEVNKNEVNNNEDNDNPFVDIEEE